MSGTKRVHYIDNLRWMTVFLLVLYHAAMAYNTWGELNYIFFAEVPAIASIVTFIAPWFMPLLFLLAGMSTYYSLSKRSAGEFLRERMVRLGIPFLFGILVITPILSLIADITVNGDDHNFFSHYEIYFTYFTDLTGYDGGFTFGHLWFIFVLLLYSVCACGIIKAGAALFGAGKRGTGRTGLIVAAIFLSLLAVAIYEVKLMGKPLIMYFCMYLLGYCITSIDAKREASSAPTTTGPTQVPAQSQPSATKEPERKSLVAKLAKAKWLLVALFLISSSADVVLFHFVEGYDTLNTVCSYLSFVTGVPALLTLGHDYLDRTSAFAAYNAKISYVFYIVHFPVVVLTQYYLDRAGAGHILNFVLTLLIAYPATYGLSVLIEKTKNMRVLFGLKKKG